MTRSATGVGDHLRDWRQRRRMSQLDLALEADVSTRRLSFVETGRAQPSRDMLLRLADQLAIPLRERNVMLVSAGFAPVFPQRSLDDPALAAARRAVDRNWNLVSANRMPGLLSFLTTTTVFGAPVDVTLSELTLETFFPANAETARALRTLAAGLD